MTGGDAKGDPTTEAMFVPEGDGIVVATMLTQGPWDPNSQYGGSHGCDLARRVLGERSDGNARGQLEPEHLALALEEVRVAAADG